jgi:hypothetical protein
VSKRPSTPNYGRAAGEWYVEPRLCVDQLLDRVPFPGMSWDPCCGMGTTVKAMRDRGCVVLASDLVDRGCPDSHYGLDFLTGPPILPSIDNIVSNFPFGRGITAMACIERALSIARGKVAAILPLPYLASVRRNPFYQQAPLQQILVCSERPSMPPGELLVAGEIEAKGGTEDYMWLVFERGWRSGPQTGWLP